MTIRQEILTENKTNDINYQIERIQKEHYLEYNLVVIKPCISNSDMCDRVAYLFYNKTRLVIKGQN